MARPTSKDIASRIASREAIEFSLPGILAMMTAKLKSLHTDFLEDLEIGQGRSQKTIANYDHYLQRFYQQQEIGSIGDITLDSVRAFRRYLNQSQKGSKNG